MQSRKGQTYFSFLKNLAFSVSLSLSLSLSSIRLRPATNRPTTPPHHLHNLPPQFLRRKATPPPKLSGKPHRGLEMKPPLIRPGLGSDFHRAQPLDEVGIQGVLAPQRLAHHPLPVPVVELVVQDV